MEQNSEDREKGKIRSFVRRKGKMTRGQVFAYDEYFNEYCIEYRPGTDMTQLMSPQFNEIVMEIGFGMGDATAVIAKKFPDIFFLGVEVHRPGIGSLLREIHEQGLHNLRIIPHDAVEVLNGMIPDDSIHGLHVFFPDPWPKKRHHKRRLFNESFVSLLSDKLKSGGYVYAVTDWEEYGTGILDVFAGNNSFVNPYNGFCPSIPWRPLTKFEKKGLAVSHKICEIYCTKS